MALTKVSYFMVNSTIVNVVDYGADPSGTTDSTVAIQAAIDSGNTVYFPEGTFIVSLSGTITLEAGTTYYSLIARDSMVLKGSGFDQTIIKLKDGESTDASPKLYNLIATNQHLDGVIIDGICFDMNGQNNKISPNRGSGIYNRYNCCTFICSGSIATVGQDARLTNHKFINNMIKNTAGVNCLIYGQSNSSGYSLGNNIEVAGNIFYNNGVDADDHTSIYAFSESVNIHSNVFYEDTMSSSIEGPYAAVELHGARNHMVNNDVYNYFMGAWLSNNQTNLSHDQLVANNTFYVNKRGVGLFYDNALYPEIESVRISNNRIWITNDNPSLSDPKIGIDLRTLYGGVKDVLVNGNTIKTTDTTNAYGILTGVTNASYSLDGIHINDNQFRNFSIGIAVGGPGLNGDLKNISVENNEVLDIVDNTANPTFTQGITVGTGMTGNLKISDNIISSDASELYYGILLSAITMDSLHLSDNFIDSAATVKISDQCTVSNQRNGKQALMFGALPNQSTWVAGDVAYNSSPSELGSASSKYIVTGWTRLTSGTGNVLNTDWFENRVLTGN